VAHMESITATTTVTFQIKQYEPVTLSASATLSIEPGEDGEQLLRDTHRLLKGVLIGELLRIKAFTADTFIALYEDIDEPE